MHAEHTEETFRIPVIERAFFFHRAVVGEERMRHILGAYIGDVALVKRDRHGARDQRRDFADRLFYHLRGHIVPVALIKLSGRCKRQLVEQFACAPVQNQLQQKCVAGAEQLHAGRFINAARFDADKAVFDQMQSDADTVPAADLVRHSHRGERIGLFAIDAHRPAFFETHGEFFGLAGSILRPHAHFWRHEMRWRCKGFELARLMREAEQIGVGRIRLLARGLDRQPVLLAVFDHLQAAAEAAEKGFVAPRRVNAKSRFHHIGDKLKAHLIVAAPGGAVAENLDAVLFNRRQKPGDRHLAAERRRVPVAAFITGLRLNAFDTRRSHFVMQGHGDEIDGP